MLVALIVGQKCMTLAVLLLTQVTIGLGILSLNRLVVRCRGGLGAGSRLECEQVTTTIVRLDRWRVGRGQRYGARRRSRDVVRVTVDCEQLAAAVDALLQCRIQSIGGGGIGSWIVVAVWLLQREEIPILVVRCHHLLTIT